MKDVYLLTVTDNNSHDNTIDRNCFTEDNTDKIFGSNSGCFYTTTKNTGTCSENSPAKTELKKLS